MKDFEVTYKGKIGRVAKVDPATGRVYWSMNDAEDYTQMSQDFINKFNPQPDAYIAQYEDGSYEYIPAEVYERDFMTDEERRAREKEAKQRDVDLAKGGNVQKGNEAPDAASQTQGLGTPKRLDNSSGGDAKDNRDGSNQKAS